MSVGIHYDPTFSSERGAYETGSGLYRVSLWRRWDKNTAPLGFAMLNPSTADAEKDDPTILRCMAFARREVAGGIVVTNLFPYRATSPKDLIDAAEAGIDVCRGVENMIQVKAMVSACPRIVLAWGSLNGRPSWCRTVSINMARFLALTGSSLFTLGTTQHGYPRHPLYLRANAPLMPFTGKEAR